MSTPALQNEMAALYPVKEGFKLRLADTAKPPSANAAKWKASALSGLLFLLVSSPFLYKLVNGLTSKLNVEVCDSDGCPTPVGMAIHAVVFVLLVRILMK